jgi:hypothetical protein
MVDYPTETLGDVNERCKYSDNSEQLHQFR